jgi:excisionase family DNA binding protein
MARHVQLTRELPAEPETIHVDDTIFTVKEVASQLNLHPGEVRRLIYAGKLTAFYRAGRRVWITKRHLQAFLQSQARQA